MQAFSHSDWNECSETKRKRNGVTYIVSSHLRRIDYHIWERCRIKVLLDSWVRQCLGGGTILFFFSSFSPSLISSDFLLPNLHRRFLFFPVITFIAGGVKAIICWLKKNMGLLHHFTTPSVDKSCICMQAGNLNVAVSFFVLQNIKSFFFASILLNSSSSVVLLSLAGTNNNACNGYHDPSFFFVWETSEYMFCCYRYNCYWIYSLAGSHKIATTSSSRLVVTSDSHVSQTDSQIDM